MRFLLQAMHAPHSSAVILLVLWIATVAGTSEQELLKEAEEQLSWMTNIRRELHKIPELKYEEVKTSAFIREELNKLGVSYNYPVAVTGIVAEIGKGLPRFALRADIDALLIQEENTDPWKSTHEGKCHCCSHDSHTAMLLGAAKLLKKREADIPGTVVLLFQPAEEGGAGADLMVKEGALKDATGVFGIHAWPAAPSGLLSSRAGVIMAATDKFVVKVHGKGGHGGMPSDTKDAIVAASMAVIALQPLISRELSPVNSGIIGITRFNTGPGSNNIHPDVVELNGTINALTAQGLEDLRQRFEEVVTGTAALYKCSATITWPQITYPPTINDKALVDLVGRVAEDLVGPEKWQIAPEPSMAAEDFAWLGDAVPGAYVWLGTGSGPGTNHGVHTPTFKMDESQMPLGAALHASVALQALSTHQQTADRGEL